MKPEHLEKVLPLTLIAIFGALIGLRVGGILPSFLATGEFDISLNLLINSGIGGVLFILTMVISISIMTIQFASQEYTHRVMTTYIRSFMVWSMIGVYLATILYDLYLTASLTRPVNPLWADVSVLLQSLCFIMLVPHVVITVAYLRPDLTIGRILRSVDRKYISTIEPALRRGKGQIPSKVDRLLLAVEVIEKCLERGDRATVRVALEDLHACCQRWVKAENEAWLSPYFLSYLLRLGRQAIIEGDDDSMAQVLAILGEIGGSLASVEARQVVIEDINTLGLGALKGDYDVAVEQMIDSLERILRSPLPEAPTSRIFDICGELAAHLFPADKRRLIRHLIGSLAGLTEMAVAKQERALIRKWSVLMEEIGRAAISHKFRDEAHRSIQAFYHMGTLGAQNGVDATGYVVESLVRMEREVGAGDRELLGEIEYAKKEVEGSRRKHGAAEKEEGGIDTSDLW
ncbi:MAG: DUF2254 domain-containing protein [Chloroflexi bacterium]|nr:DUF2254 domain-containing protein [Chloroflexota bacterium]